MKHILITLFLFLFASAVYADEIAITFDDLPGQQDESAENQRVINKRILQALKKFNAPAIGFVNEGKFYSKGQESEKIAIIKLWVDDGHPLGNHTYSHKFLSSLKADEFQRDVIKGAQVSKKLMADSGLPYRIHGYCMDTL
jgi:peptidoglycan/xylan/chitin deacetylase (PgdA/CDA1 family)